MNPLWQFGSGGAFVEDAEGLPCVSLPAGSPRETRPGLPQPFFLIGNHDLTAFLSADGGVHLFTMDRAAARLNPGGHPAEGNSSSRVRLVLPHGESFHDLRASPLAERAGRLFGCGFASYRYDLAEGVTVERRWHTFPSENPSDGCPALLLVMLVHNTTGSAVDIEWQESVVASYDMGFWHNGPCRRRRACYEASATQEADFAEITFAASEETPFIFDGTGTDAYADGCPPSIRWHCCAGHELVPLAENCSRESAQAGVTWRTSLPPGQSAEARTVVSVARSATAHCDAAGRFAMTSESELRASWSRRIPEFDHESDRARRAEMRWHFAVLHMMANRHAATGETYVPQGTVYEYALGCSAVIRDHLAHALPLCYCDPDLARSILRFAAKLMQPDGALRTGIEGAGRIPLGPDQKSDSQLYFLWLVSEFLDANPDPEVLMEAMSPLGDLLEHALRAFVYLRDVVGIGPHGLVRVLCSDWNDLFYLLVGHRPYHEVFSEGESHLNTAMGVVVLGRFAKTVESLSVSLAQDRRDLALRLCSAARVFRSELLDAFLADWGDHPFPARARVGEFVWGRGDMVAEVMSWSLQIEGLTEARRRSLWNEIQARLLAGEGKGIRQAECPVAKAGTPAGERENGGFWFALHGPLVSAVAKLDPRAGQSLASQMSLRNHHAAFPGEWIGAWSAPDSFNSLQFGLSDAVAPYVQPFPLYCAHAHAWPLWCALLANNRSQI